MMRLRNRAARRWIDGARRRLAFAILGSIGLASLAGASDLPHSPLSPADALQAFQLDPELKIELVAAEPDVVSPVFIAFDPRGRLWVVEMHDYPNGPTPGEPGSSRIRVLTDEDGDGRYENPVTFAEQLLFANTLMFWKDGVLVTTDGRLDFFADRDGDGRAEFRETWFQGFARENPQLRCNHPTLGLDGWIYVANGLRGGQVVAARPDWPDRSPIELGARDFRFNPETGEAETTSGFGQYGMSFDDYGRRFLCSNRNPGMHAVLPESALRRNPEVSVTAVIADACAAAENSRIRPVSRFWVTSNLHEGQFTAACGVKIFRGNGLPSGFYGNIFTCDPTGNLIHCEVLEPAGATFRGRNPYEDREFLATPDTWFRAVDTTVGPDGAMYVVDMHRAVIEHPEYMPDELKTRPDLTLGDDCGRIYRIRAAEAPAHSSPSLVDDASSDQLVSLLDHPNVWQRETAFRLLCERRPAEAVASLRKLLGSASTPAGVTNVLWALAALDALSLDDIQQGFAFSDPNVDEQCVQLIEQKFANSQPARDLLYERAAAPITARLRFQIALTLGALPADARRPAALARLLAEGLDDPWLATAVAISAEEDIAQTASLLLNHFASSDATQTPDALSAAGRLLEVVGGRGRPEELTQVLAAMEPPAVSAGAGALTVRSRLWQRLAAGLRSRGHNAPALLTTAAREAGVSLDTTFETALSVGADISRPIQERIAAIQLLEFCDFDQALGTLESCSRDPELSIAIAAVATLSRQGDVRVPERLVADFSARSPGLRREILSALMTSDARIATLLDEIDAGRISPSELDPVRMQQLQRVQNPELRERVMKLAAAHAPADRSEVIANYQPALTKIGNPRKGRELFAKNCTQCHRIGDLGVNVAPDISDSRVKVASQLLTDILDPNRAIDNNYFNYAIVDREGLVHTGIIASETATSITLRQPENREVTIPRSSIDEVKSLGVSLMPVGLEKELSVDDMADLISFIKNWRYLDGAVPKEVIR